MFCFMEQDKMQIFIAAGICGQKDRLLKSRYHRQPDLIADIDRMICFLTGNSKIRKMEHSGVFFQIRAESMYAADPP